MSAAPPPILHRTVSTIVYRATHRGPGVPYGPIKHEDGRTNFGFVDLKGSLEKAAQIAEAVGKPGLIAFLEYCANPDSPFITLGCENGIFPVENAVASGPQVYVGSYLNLAFAEIGTNTEEAIQKLAIDLADRLGDTRADWVKYEIGVERCSLFNILSFCLEINCIGHGFDDAMAWDRWETGYRKLLDAAKHIAALQ